MTREDIIAMARKSGFLIDGVQEFVFAPSSFHFTDELTAFAALVAAAAKAEQPEFFTHIVEHPYDWSEWVCPDPKNYLMKCCDCGLVHEAEFGVVRYKSETEREDCDMVDDTNLQAVFRIRRSEQWSPVDTAHRSGGFPMEDQPAIKQDLTPEQNRCKFPLCHNEDYQQALAEQIKRELYTDETAQPKQEPVAWMWIVNGKPHNVTFGGANSNTPKDWTVLPLYTSSQPAQRTWVGLTDEEIEKVWRRVQANDFHDCVQPFARAIEAKLREKNT